MRALALCVLACAVVPVAACTDELPSEGTSGQAVTTHNRIATNRIATNRIATNRIATNRIATNALAAGDLAGQTLDLDPEAVKAFFVDEQGQPFPDGEIVLEYLISCAFPEGATFRGPSFEGPDRDYEGGVGLAPYWATRKLTSTEKGWISACMIARVNVNAIPLEISLRGPHRALGISPEEAERFNVEEGAFYGDIFTGEAPIQVFACNGTRAGAETAVTAGDRQCATAGDGTGTTPCDMVYTGACATACEDLNGANADPGYYQRCHDASTANPKSGWAGTRRFDQVITTFIY